MTSVAPLWLWLVFVAFVVFALVVDFAFMNKQGAHEVGVKEALIVGAVLAFVAFLLVLTTNTATIAWSVLGLVLSLVYPYAKRHVSMPQAVLGVAFSFGIPMAFAAVTEAVPWQAWALMAVNLFWVLAYDTEYAMVDRDDDLKIGMKTSAITLGRADVPAIAAFYLVWLAAWTALIWPQAQIRPWVWGLTLLVALAQVAWHVWLISDRSREGCFRAFRTNHWLGFTVFAGTALVLA